MSEMIQYSCISHVGSCRAVNQDCFVCGNRYFQQNGEDLGVHLRGRLRVEKPVLLGVFDGMGGEEWGDVAAAIGARTAAGAKLVSGSGEELRALCLDINRRICAYAKANGIRSMGSTVAMLAFSERGAVLCNIGDSKVFRFSGGRLTQLSEDHLSAAAYGRKPELFQNLGIPEEEMILEPYISNVKLRRGDLMLICSDGLTDMVGQEELAWILGNTAFAEAGEALLGRALERGGLDNITLILIRT